MTISPGTAGAILRLQDALERAQTCDHRRAELYDAALNELIENPERQGSPEALVDSALANARKRWRRRHRLGPMDPLPQVEAGDEDVAPEAVPGNLTAGDTFAHCILEVESTLQLLSPADSRVLALLAAGGEASDVANDLQCSLSRAYVRLHRARRRARAARAVEVAA